MKRYILPITLVLTLWCYFYPKHSFAFIPSINVHVVNGVTGAPINGLWIRWSVPNPPGVGWAFGYDGDTCGSPCSSTGTCGLAAPRHEITTNDGTAVFRDIESVPTSTCNQMIDTNFDGTTDSKYLDCLPGTDSKSNSCFVPPDYSCLPAPNEFSVIVPDGELGTYTKYQNLTINNHNNDYNITLYYYPPGVPNEPPFQTCGDGVELGRVQLDAYKATNNDYTFSSTGAGTGYVKMYTGIGHSWSNGCLPGYGNDGGAAWCDQVQNDEAVTLRWNGSAIGSTEDIGADYVMYKEFPITINNGNNVLNVQPLNPATDMSVYVKGTICKYIRSRRATNKRIGTYDPIEQFKEKTDLTKGNEYWLRFDLVGDPNVGDPRGIFRVLEYINNTYFTILNPQYNATTPSLGTFFLTGRNSSGDVIDQTNSECPDANSDSRPDCITSINSDSIDFTVDSSTSSHSELTLYFKVRAIQATAPLTYIDVDKNTSTFTAVTTGYTEPMDNFKVTIADAVTPSPTPTPPVGTVSSQQSWNYVCQSGSRVEVSGEGAFGLTNKSINANPNAFWTLAQLTAEVNSGSNPAGGVQFTSGGISTTVNPATYIAPAVSGTGGWHGLDYQAYVRPSSQIQATMIGFSATSESNGLAAYQSVPTSGNWTSVGKTVTNYVWGSGGTGGAGKRVNDVQTLTFAPLTTPTTLYVTAVVQGNEADARSLTVTATAGTITQSASGNNPNSGSDLDIHQFTLANVPTGTATVTITLTSPETGGDSAWIAGVNTTFSCPGAPSPTPTPIVGGPSCDIYAYQEHLNLSDVQLVKVNPSTGASTNIGSVVYGKEIESLAMDPTTQQMYTVSQYIPGIGGELYKVDPTTGSLTKINNITPDEISSLAFKPTDGTLWGWDHADGLYEINKNTGTTTLRFAYNSDTEGSGKVIEGMTWTLDGTKAYVVRGSTVGSPSDLWLYTQSTNSMQSLFTDAFPGVAASLDTLPDGTLLVGLEGGENDIKIIQYNPVTNTIMGTLYTDTTHGDAEGVTRRYNCPNITSAIPNATLQGKVFLDINNNCTQDAGESSTNEASVELNKLLPASCPSYSNSQTPSASGDYSFNNLNCFDATNHSMYRLSIVPTNSSYTTTTCGGQFNIDETPGSVITKNLGLTIIRDPWFQGVGGGIHANGTITSLIPNTATDRNLIRSPTGYSPDVGSGESLSTDNGTISSTNWEATDYTQNNYLELTFTSLADSMLPYIDRNNWNGSPPSAADATSDGVAVYYAQSNNITLSGNWQDINFPVIIIVEGNTSGMGDITIRDNITNGKITLGPNGFMLMVAEHDVIVENNIGENVNSSTGVNLEGIFIAGHSFNAGGAGDRLVDRRINIAGTVITGVAGSGSYVSNRTHEENHLYPSDYFIFDPKLLLNAPSIVSEPIYSWTEVR
ncbi:hypothetical protein HGA91_02775 [candidate division WWE3 bacterium]|nr:hypothetical protein [candidate division WWE3 bacterium]